MTYTEAAMCNKLTAVNKDPKQLGDGVNLRWVQDTNGNVGYVRATRADAVLIAYPTKVLKHHVMLAVHSWPIAEWRSFTKL